MSTPRRIKFPLDVSRENSKDMFKLKFIRKSEMEPTVRHHLKHAVSQMDKQLDVWFKEQTFTLGTISKQQDKLCQSRKRLKKEQRRIKRKEYEKQQEEIRSKLHGLRLRVMLRKAVQKFKANVVKAREYRNAELDKLGPTVRTHVTSDSATGNIRKARVEQDVVTINRGQENVLLGIQRFPSSRGRQMEPIPEEVEIEVDDIEEKKPKPRLTKRRLQRLNRTKSTRAVLDIKATVPLLPDLYVPPKHRVNRNAKHKDSDDKETQTSLERERSQSPGKDEITDRSEKKTKSIVVKLPIATKSTQSSRRSRSNSIMSNKSLTSSVKGIHGSDTEFSDSDTDSDESNSSSGNSFSEADSWNNTSDYESSFSSGEYIPEISLTLTRYRNKGRQKNIDTKTLEETYPHRQNLPDECILPELALLSDSKHNRIQNPHLPLYKERSFYIEPKSKDRFSGGADDGKLLSKDDLSIHKVKGEKQKENSDLTCEASRDNSFVYMDESANDMAVFGKKADYNARKQHKTPPNTPADPVSDMTKHTSRNQLNLALTNKKRTKSLDKQQTSLNLDEPFQRYEKGKTGKLLPIGMPKTYHAEFPSMREKYKRDKLLKMERDAQFNQDMKMRRFFSSFDKGDFSSSTSYPPSQLTPLPEGLSGYKNKGFTNFVFKVFSPEGEDSYSEKQIIPGAETTSVRLLRNCRYLREYKPLPRADNLVYPHEKETSWQMNTSSVYKDKYLANVRLKLF